MFNISCGKLLLQNKQFFSLQTYTHLTLPLSSSHLTAVPVLFVCRPEKVPLASSSSTSNINLLQTVLSLSLSLSLSLYMLSLCMCKNSFDVVIIIIYSLHDDFWMCVMHLAISNSEEKNENEEKEILAIFW